MKKVGIIGGIGPASTIEYYNGIISGYRNMSKDDNYPQLYINSINMTEMLNYVANRDVDKLLNLLVNEINKLITIGADYIAIASNTPHMVINEITKKVNIPIISIVEETCKYTTNLNLKKVLLTGTLFTMQNYFYQKEFEKINIECIVPNDNDKRKIHNIIFPNLENGIIIEEDKKIFIDICNKIKRESDIDGIVLGCTELPLMIKSNDFEIPVLDTMEIHINSILDKLIKG